MPLPACAAAGSASSSCLACGHAALHKLPAPNKRPHPLVRFAPAIAYWGGAGCHGTAGDLEWAWADGLIHFEWALTCLLLAITWHVAPCWLFVLRLCLLKRLDEHASKSLPPLPDGVGRERRPSQSSAACCAHAAHQIMHARGAGMVCGAPHSSSNCKLPKLLNS